MREAAFDALAKYAVDVADLRLLQYEDNAVYRVAASDRSKFMLRIGAPSGHSRVQQASEMEWLKSLSTETSLRVPIPVPARDGSTVVEVKDRSGSSHVCALLRWLPGRVPEGSVRSKVAYRFGETTAALHKHAVSFTAPPWFDRKSWLWEDLLGDRAPFRSARARDRLSGDQRRVLEEVAMSTKDRLEGMSAELKRTALAHADLHRGNFVVDDDENVGVIDFDDCGEANLMLDVATVLSSLYRLGLRHYKTLRSSYLSGYDSVRPLPPGLEDELSVFLILRDMVIVNFIADTSNKNVLSWGPSRLDGIVELLKDYLRTDTYRSA